MPARLAPVELACLLAPRDPLLQLLPVAECVSVCVCVWGICSHAQRLYTRTKLHLPCSGCNSLAADGHVSSTRGNGLC